MVNSRVKGRASEQYFARRLRKVFPNATRNWQEQTAIGGVDLANTSPFDFECKSGGNATLKTIKNWLDQVEEEGNEENFNVILAKPDKKRGRGNNKFEPYVVMPLKDFEEILEILKGNDLI